MKHHHISRSLPSFVLLLSASACFGERERDRPPAPGDTAVDTEPGDSGSPPEPGDTGAPLEPDSSCGDLAAWIENVEQGLELIAVADSSALGVEALVLEARARALMASSEPTSETDRELLFAAIDALVLASDAMASAARWDDLALADGSVESWEVEVGAAEPVVIELGDLRAETLGIDSATLDIDDVYSAQGSLDLLAAGRDGVDAWRSSLGVDHAVLLAWGRSLELQYAACDDPCTTCGESRFAGLDDDIGGEPEEAERGVLEALVANVEDGLGLVSAADGGAQAITSLLEDMRELAVESSSETMADDERAYRQDTFEGLSADVDRQASSTAYNEHTLLDGLESAVDVQVGDANSSMDRVGVELAELSSMSLCVDTGCVDLSTATGAQAAIDTFDTALDTVAAVRASLLTSQAVLEAHHDDLERRLGE